MSSTGFGSESAVERRLERSCYPRRQGLGSYESCSGDSLSSITGPSSFGMEVRRPPAQDDSHAPFSAADQTAEMVGILSGGGGDGGIAPSLNLFTCQVPSTSFQNSLHVCSYLNSFCRQLSENFDGYHSAPGGMLEISTAQEFVHMAPHDSNKTQFTTGSDMRIRINCGRLVAKPERVFVWDLDETLVIFNSLLNGDYAKKFDKDEPTCVSLGLRMEKMICNLAEEQLFIKDVEEFNQTNIDDTNSDEFNFAVDGLLSTTLSSDLVSGEASCCQRQDKMEKLTQRFRQIRENYSSNRTNVGGLLGSEKRKSWLQLRSDIEDLTNNWVSLAAKTLSLVNSRSSCVNALVTMDPLVSSLAKVLLYGLGGAFAVENIYSAANIGKDNCFKRIASRFGDKCTYIVVGHKQDDELAAKQMNWPFWRISSHSDITALHHALDLGYL